MRLDLSINVEQPSGKRNPALWRPPASFPEGQAVMNSIRYRRLDATDDQVIAAAKLASADTFDEATFSVDTRTEPLIQRAFGQLLEGHASFVIAIASARFNTPTKC